MLRKNRFLTIAVFVSITLGFVWWARAITSWRPQQIGAWPPLAFDDVLVEDDQHGPWLRFAQHELQNVESGKKLALPASYQNTELKFSPDGRSFAFVNRAGRKQNMVWCDAESGRALKTFAVPKGKTISDFAFCSEEKSLRLLMSDGVETIPLDGSSPHFFPLAELQGIQTLSADGDWLVASIPDGKNGCAVKIYDLQKQRLDRQLATGIQDLDSCQLSPDGALVFISEARNDKGSGESWMLDSHNGNRLWKGSFDLFAPDGNSVLSFNSSNTGQMQDARTGSVTRALHFPVVVKSAQFSGDSNWLYLLSDTGTLWKMRVR